MVEGGWAVREPVDCPRTPPADPNQERRNYSFFSVGCSTRTERKKNNQGKGKKEKRDEETRERERETSQTGRREKMQERRRRRGGKSEMKLNEALCICPRGVLLFIFLLFIILGVFLSTIPRSLVFWQGIVMTLGVCCECVPGQDEIN